MMKFRKLMLLSVIIVGSFVDFQSPNINAKITDNSFMHTNRSTYPKSMRGSWYYVDGYNHNRVVKLSIGKSILKTYNDGKYDYTNIIKKFKNHNMDTQNQQYLKKTQKWGFIESISKIDGYKWIVIRGWN